MNHVHSSPVLLKNADSFFDWQYTLKGALLVKKLWPIVGGTEIQPTVTPPPAPEFVPPACSAAQIPEGATAAEIAVAEQLHNQQHLVIIQQARAAAQQAATLRAAEHVNKYINLQIDYDRCAGVALGMIYLSIDPSLKPLVTNLETPAKAYTAICACYEPQETSQLIRYHSELFALKMEVDTDLHAHFDQIDMLV